ncbi:hypothetical protein B7463_g457, partial [Scytalidium lignicola]
MSSSLPIQIAETIQTASIKRNPSPTHDLNPSTAATTKDPVTVSSRAPVSDLSLNKFDYEVDDGIDEEDEDDIPDDILQLTPRRTSFGPLPDLRFEQSYLASIAAADSRWKVVYITIRDQVCESVPPCEAELIGYYEGYVTTPARHDMVTGSSWLEILEQECATQW